jgi:outer membrane protein TolC
MNMKLALIFALTILGVTSVFSQQNTLDYYLSHAINNSPLIKDLQNQVLSFSIDSQIVRAGLRPQVTGNSNNMYAPVIKGYGYDEAITNVAQVSALVSVNKSFISNKSLQTQLATSRIQSLTATNNIRITQQDLRKTITDQYIVAYGEQLQLQSNRQIGDLLRKEDSLLRRLTQNSVYKQTDYLSFLVTVQQQELTTAELEIQYEYDVATLNYLAGINDTALIALADPQLRLVSIPELSTSVFFRQFVFDSLKLKNDRALIDINYRPKINVFGDGGYNSSLQFDPYKNFGISFGLSLAIPIYDGHQRKLQYQKIDLQEQTRQARRNFFINQQQQQINQLRRQLSSTDQLIEQINKQITYIETLIQTNHKLLATGDVRLTDFILSINNYLTAKALVTQNYVNRLKIVSQLNYWGY